MPCRVFPDAKSASTRTVEKCNIRAGDRGRRYEAHRFDTNCSWITEVGVKPLPSGMGI
jgi:hypothetical protein